MYETCHYISLHIPANDKTKSIGYRFLSKLPKGGCLINTARKEVINEEELVKVMEERADIKYCSDVAPDNAAEMAENFKHAILLLLKKWEPKLPKQISMPD